MTSPSSIHARPLALFFSPRGRIPRGVFWAGSLGAIAVFLATSALLTRLAGPRAALALYPPLHYALLCLAVKRCHDYARSGARLALGLVPLVGTAWIAIELAWRHGTPCENRYGPQPRYHGLDHLVVATPTLAPGGATIVNDVTQMNAVQVLAVIAPRSIEELQEALRRTDAPVSIGGGHFSMGGQTASPGTVHVDLRALAGVVWLRPMDKRVRVQAGLRWCDLQRFLDAHGLAVKVMQTYANFTVGGSLSVNGHGRYVGQGPLVLSVRAIDVVLADGSRVSASPIENAEIFYGAIGGYGALGIIVEAELDLVDNVRVARSDTVVARARYLEHFKQGVRANPKAIFHNADLYPPHYERCRGVTWSETEDHVTVPARLMRAEPTHHLYRYLAWAMSESPFGKWRREHLFDPLLFRSRPVHWRNYEAGYDVAELEPAARATSTYVLQEYFVPVGRFDEFVPRMREIFRRHDVNVLNVSVRHALPDPGTLLAWAREEVFAFVVYYKQRTDEASRGAVAVWTRELIDAALACGGRHYLPYQPHATEEQVHAAYPRMKELFALKDRLDPHYRLRGALWDKYYAPRRDGAKVACATSTEVHAVLADDRWSDRLYLFFQNVYRLFPEAPLHALVREAAAERPDEEGVYRLVQEGLARVCPPLQPITHALPALANQKREMARQALELLGARKEIRGYLEIGSIGRYASALRGRVRLEGPLFVMNDAPPTNSPADLAERGGLAKIGTHLPLDYTPVPASVEDDSLDVVTCFIGLHHAPREQVGAFVRSIARVLRPGGSFLLRDHDAPTAETKRFVSLIHTLFNCGLGVPWTANAAELRFFLGIDETIALVEEHGLRVSTARLLQANDPTDNVLLLFRKEAA
ncbi:MAG TPA: FAD-binding protein [Polyangiaceae bacterium]